MPASDPAKTALFWVGLLCAVASTAWTQRVPVDDPSWTPGGTGVCWRWRAEDGTIAECCRVRAGLWWDAQRRVCDGVHPGHGAAEPTR